MVAENLEDLYIRYISKKLAHLDLGKPEDLTRYLDFAVFSQAKDKRESLWERGIRSMKNYSVGYSFIKRVKLLVVALLIKKKLFLRKLNVIFLKNIGFLPKFELLQNS